MRALILALWLLLPFFAMAQAMPECYPNCLPCHFPGAPEQCPPPDTEDEARDRVCRENPTLPECLQPPGVLPYPTCEPANFGGTGSLIYSSKTDDGQWHFFYCPTEPGKPWVGFGFVMGLDRLLIFVREPRATASQLVRAYWAFNAFKPKDDAERRLEAAMMESLNKYLPYAYAPYVPPINEPTPPPPPQPLPPAAGSWVTSGLSRFNTTMGGALSGFAGTGARGIPCDCTRPIKVGATTYCTFQGAPGPHVVAACKQVAP